MVAAAIGAEGANFTHSQQNDFEYTALYHSGFSPAREAYQVGDAWGELQLAWLQARGRGGGDGGTVAGPQGHLICRAIDVEHQGIRRGSSGAGGT